MSNSATPEPGSERITRSSVRNPRRRQRESNAESVKTAPRRKRSKINENTFVPPRHDEEEENVNGTIEVASPNGSIQPVSPKRGRGRPRKDSNSNSNSNSTAAMEVAIPVREKKNSVKRPTRGDGATLLAQHPKYSVKLLPSTLRELRREGVEYRGTLGAGHHALAVTRKSAYIWDYTAHTAVSSPRIFDVPFAVKDTDPPPFGALVATARGTDFGLLLISASTGEVFFYESIERAASLGLFQDRKIGVAGSVGALYSGESVIDLISADHAGFIVTLSSGRIAQLALRDTQGRAGVSSQFLKATEPQQHGFFGGLKGLLGSSGWTKDVAAVRTRPLGTRGQMQVVSLTVRGEVQLWDLDWSGQYAFRGTIDGREILMQELKNLESPEVEGRSENFSAVDFVILQKPSAGNEVTTVAAELPLDLAILLQNGASDKYSYALAEMSLEGTNVTITRVLELDTYNGGLTAGKKPRLVLPKAHHTAFVSFPDAIVLAAMEESQLNSPEAQLHASYVEPAPFEDTVYLKQDNRFAVLSTCEEETKANQSSVVVFVKGAGMMRITAVDPDTIARLPRTPANSKIEQAIFHGALHDGNIIDFSRPDTTSAPEEVRKAALEISNEILTSTSPFVSTTPTSIETHLIDKARALEALVRHVRQTYPALDRASMWQLLWDAERVAAAQQMWKTFEEHVAASSQKKRTATLVDELCAVVTRQVNPELGEDDVPSAEETVRQFFIHNLQHVERIFPTISTYLKNLSKDNEIPPQKKLQMLLQSNELWNRSLETVFSFRMEHAASYGILPEFIEDGILTDVVEYVDLPEFWTSTESMLKACAKISRLSRELCSDEYDNIDEGIPVPEVPRIGAENPLLIETLCHIYQERINWISSRPDARSQEKAERLQASYEQTRHDEFRALAALAQAEAGIRLAEKYKDMLTLTEIIVSEMQYALETRLGTNSTEDQRINQYITELTARTTKYFEKYGDDWANAYFDFGFSGSHAGIMLQLAQQNWPEPLTRYLRADPSRAKLCWIDDIWAAKDFKHAQKCLDETAHDQETQLWAKKIELSMSKLCTLAGQEASASNSATANGAQTLEARVDRDLEIVQIQEDIFLHVLPETLEGIDDQAKLELCMRKFGRKNQDLHALRKVLEAGFERVLFHIALSVDELIDVLTLMDSDAGKPGADSELRGGKEFYFALKALDTAAPSMPQARVELLLQLIWKRCYVYDNWVELNSTQKEFEAEVGSALKETMPWRTLYYALDRDLFGPDSNVRRLTPSECLGAGCLPEELEYRWPEPDILHLILNDNKIQDEQLRGFVQDRRLDEWIEKCYNTAKNEVDTVAQERAALSQRERDFEEQFERAALEKHDMNGHAKGPNGIEDDETELYDGDGAGEDSVQESDLYQPVIDVDEDIEME